MIGARSRRITRSGQRSSNCSIDAATVGDHHGSVDPPRVLIVDDHPVFRRVARELLEARGYAVVGEAGCAASALEATERLVPDAVLLDVRLGDDSGIAVARALRRFDRPPAVLLVSVCDEGDGEERARACGARGFLPKARLAATDLGCFWPRAPRKLAAGSGGVSVGRDERRRPAGA